MITDQVRTGIPPGAELPVAHLLGHRFLRQARQVILALLLTGLAAAMVYMLLGLVLAAAGGLGPHPPWPPPPPKPPPHPPPAPPPNPPRPRARAPRPPG